MPTILYNPQCSTCRNTLALMEEQGCTPEIIEYLKNPPTHAELRSILKKLGLPARALLRTKEAAYQELGLDNPALTEDQLIDVMVTTPRLIERPVVISEGKAVIGRPPERVLEIL
jgi:arsenate reductase